MNRALKELDISMTPGKTMKSPGRSWRFFHGKIMGKSIRHGDLKKASLMIKVRGLFNTSYSPNPYTPVNQPLEGILQKWCWQCSDKLVYSFYMELQLRKLLDLAKINQQTRLRVLSLQVKHWNPLALSLVFLTAHGASIIPGEFSLDRVTRLEFVSTWDVPWFSRNFSVHPFLWFVFLGGLLTIRSELRIFVANWLWALKDRTEL